MKILWSYIPYLHENVYIRLFMQVYLLHDGHQIFRHFKNVTLHQHPAKFSPDSNDLAPVKFNSVHLCDEDGSHGLIERCAVHVNGGPHWEDKPRYSFVNAQVLLQTTECDRQGASTVENKTGGTKYILWLLKKDCIEEKAFKIFKTSGRQNINGLCGYLNNTPFILTLMG